MEGLRKELQVRSRICSIYNKRPEEFPTKTAYDDYLEEREDVIFALTQDSVDHTTVEAKIAEYKRANSRSINANRVLQMEQTRANVDAGATKANPAQQVTLLGEEAAVNDSYIPGTGNPPPHLTVGFGNLLPTPLEKVELNGDGGFKGRGKQPKNAQDWFKMAAAAGWSRQDYTQAVMPRVFTSSILCVTGIRKE